MLSSILRLTLQDVSCIWYKKIKLKYKISPCV
jgi:hypothetical protein